MFPPGVNASIKKVLTPPVLRVLQHHYCRCERLFSLRVQQLDVRLTLCSSGRDNALLHHPPLRTVRASFPAYSSSLCKALFDQSQQPTFFLGYGVACDSSDVAIPSCSCCHHRLGLLEERDEDSIPCPSLFSLRISDTFHLVNTTGTATYFFP